MNPSLPDQSYAACPTCFGWGRVPQMDRLAAGEAVIGKDDPPCSTCGGSGVAPVAADDQLQKED